MKTRPFDYKFRRQHPFGIYILDFYCHKLKLVIEVDGSIHLEEEVKNHDEERQKLLEAEGLTIMRFTNEEVLMKQEAVISSIEQFIGNHSERTK